MRIALVNDLRLALVALERIVASLPDATVAWTAEDGAQAVQRCGVDTPDMILMDMLMPVMDGVEATRRIMKNCPCPIVVVTATVEGNADRVFEALGHGALDAVNTPVLGTGGSLCGAEELVRKIRMVQRLSGPVPRSTAPVHPVSAPRSAFDAVPPLVAIGSSTGGPQALVRVLKELPKPLPCGVTIIQHVDSEFAPGLATWLASETQLPVELLQPGTVHRTGVVGLAGTDEHLILDKGARYRYVAEPIDHIHKPSVDVFFDSLCMLPVSCGVGVLLTGMGQDGARGLLALRESGWHTIAQDEQSSVVWGMPGSAVRINAAAEVLPVDDIGAAVSRALRSRTC